MARFKNDSTISFWLLSDFFEELLLRPDMNIPNSRSSYPFHCSRYIAKACPNLKSLRYWLCIRDPTDIVASPSLSHQLRALSVNNEGKLEQHQILGIARISIKSIKPHDGNYTEQWRFIYDSLKSDQAVRMDELRRLGIKPEGEVKFDVAWTSDR